MKDININPVSLIIGLLMIFIGVGFLLEQIGVLSAFNISFFGLLWRLWPLVLIVIGLFLLIRKSVWGGFVLLFFGIIFQISVLVGWSIWGVFWPVIIIIIGLSVLFKKSFAWKGNTLDVGDTDVEITAFFDDQNKKIKSNTLEKVELTAIFGSIYVDLEEVEFKEGAEITATAIFGDVKFMLPEGLAAEISSTGVFGAGENNYNTRDEKGTKVEVTATGIFGAVEVR